MLESNRSYDYQLCRRQPSFLKKQGPKQRSLNTEISQKNCNKHSLYSYPQSHRSTPMSYIRFSSVSHSLLPPLEFYVLICILSILRIWRIFIGKENIVTRRCHSSTASILRMVGCRITTLSRPGFKLRQYFPWCFGNNAPKAR